MFDLSCLVNFGETTACSSNLIVPSSREFGAMKSLVFSFFFEIPYGVSTAEPASGAEQNQVQFALSLSSKHASVPAEMAGDL